MCLFKNVTFQSYRALRKLHAPSQLFSQQGSQRHATQWPFLLCLFVCLCALAGQTQASLSTTEQNTTQDNFTSTALSHSPFSKSPAVIDVDQAFQFDFSQQGNMVKLTWQIQPGYYLYQDKFSFSPQQATLAKWAFPQPQMHQDEFFGKVATYHHHLELTIPLVTAQQQASLLIRYQGCADKTFCYPPKEQRIPLQALALHEGQPLSAQTPPHEQDSSTAAAQRPATAAATHAPSQSIAFHQSLQQNIWAPLLFFVLGIGLAFTPCVLPMYPILTSIVLGSGKQSLRRTFSLSFTYVQGMALTYTGLGLVVASAGLQFQAALQHPAVLVGISIVFILLALSMFDLYQLQLPSGLLTKLTMLSNQQQAGHYLGVFVMGAISGLICSPCTTAPLSGALLYVAQTGDLWVGGISLYALALGMGVPLILAAVFGQQLLPKAGMWMNQVKTFFGFVLLAAPIFFLARLLSEQITTTLWAILAGSLASWLYHTHLQTSSSKRKWQHSAMGILAVIGLCIATTSLVHIWQLLPQTIPTRTVTDTSPAQAKTLPFQTIEEYSQLEQALQQAKQNHQAVMLDFYADWCVACKEYETYTFNNVDLQNTLRPFVLLQVNATDNTAADQVFFDKLQVLGLPTIIFWDSDGKRLPSKRVTGFMSAADFMQNLDGIR